MNNVIKLYGANGQLLNKSEETVGRPANAFSAEYPHSQVSNRYNQVKTVEVAQVLEENGWEVVKYAEARVRDPERRGFQKHFVWMRPKGRDNQIQVGDTEMRLILTNSHDGTSAFRLQAGLHRLVCSNGLVVSMGDIQHIAIRHTDPEIAESAVGAAVKIAAMAPKINEVLAQMQLVELNPEKQLDFARNAAKIVWEDKPDYINPSELLLMRRNADKGNSVWSTYNRVQENLVRGGLSVVGSNRHTRGINSPIRDIEINKELFELAFSYAA